MFCASVSYSATKTQNNMKNNIIIRLENTLFNTNNINNHLSKAKDKNQYINNNLPKCKLNNDMIEMIDFINKVKTIKTVNVIVVSQFTSEIVWKLLRNNNLAWVQLKSSIENVCKCVDKSTTVLISTNENDLQCAMQYEIACTNEISINAIGVRKATPAHSKAA